jgi:hypothetical protein
MRGVCTLAILSLLVSACLSYAGSVCSITPAPKLYKLSVCTMIFNEARYIEEWLAYHLLLKVDHFYIYNDGSSDNIQEVLDPYIELGLVTLLPWGANNRTIDASLVPEEPIFTVKQRYAIGDCLYNHQNETEWFGVFDVDEFLVLNSFFPDFHSFLPFAISNADDYPIPLNVYGTSYHATTPNGWVLEDYQWRSTLTTFGINPHDNKFSGKSLYKSGCGLPNVHFTNELRPGCRKFCGWVSSAGTGHHLPLIVNHYAVKSWAHYQEKIAKWHFGLLKEDFDKYEEYSNKVWDNSMTQFVRPVSNLVECMRR